LGPLPLTIARLEETLQRPEQVAAFLAGEGQGGNGKASSGSASQKGHAGQHNRGRNAIPEGYAGQRYVYVVEPPINELWSPLKRLLPLRGAHAASRGSVRASLRCDFRSEDAIELVLRTAKARQTCVDEGTKGNSPVGGGKGGGGVHALVHAAEEVSPDELHRFVEGMRATGWQVAPFMLSSTEKQCYAPVA